MIPFWGKAYLSILIVVVGYHAASFAVFQFLNHKANQTTFYAQYIDVVSWKVLENFQ